MIERFSLFFTLLTSFSMHFGLVFALLALLFCSVVDSANTWAFHLAPGVDPEAFAKEHGLVLVRNIAGLPQYYEFADAEGRARRFSMRDAKSSSWDWAEEQTPRVRVPRSVEVFGSENEPDDPLYKDQWHHAVMSVQDVWATGNRGEGATVAVVDDGLWSSHEDLSPNFCKECSHDFNSNKDDPTPTTTTDQHGTRASGVVAARDNNVCGVGVAYRATLAGIRLIADYTTDALEAEGLSFMSQKNDIYSCSWGPTDDGRRLEGPGPLLRAAFEHNVNTGRGGKGVIYVWASGNGRASSDTCNYDGYANSRFTIAIGAVGEDMRVSYYSEGCAALMAVAPSSSSGYRSITTVDYRSSDPKSCYNYFGGTSAAAPSAAGVIALMLSANPELTWRDVQHIIVATSVPVTTSDSTWALINNDNPVTHTPLYHSDLYGFGLLNATAAVNLSKNWKTVAPLVSWSSGIILVNQPIDDNVDDGVTSAVYVTKSLRVEWVEVVLESDHSQRGDLDIILTSPSGVKSQLATVHFDVNEHVPSWTFTSFVPTRQPLFLCLCLCLCHYLLMCLYDSKNEQMSPLVTELSRSLGASCFR